MNKLLATFCAGLALCTSLAASAANAAAWPEKPVTMLVPFPPGGSTDNVARILSAKFAQQFGGSFVIDNRPGAAGMIGAAMAKRAPADGYTLFVSSLGPFVIGPHLTKTAGYDPLKDFDYISVAVQAPNVLAVPVNSPHKTIQDVIAYEKAHPNKMTFASAGNGTSDHLTAELFWQQTNTNGIHVPYKGGAPALNDLIGGQVDATFMNINTAVPHIKAGKIRALAITSTARSPILPDVPTMDEAGIKGVTVYSWQAIAAPKGIPADLKTKLQAAVVSALNDPSVKPRLLELGFEIVANTPEQFAAFQANEYARWKKVIEVGKITAD
ncbi:tripartite tricarboxylate transporter substrate binding protein [Cupriavidus pauculus]|uniref:Tripartite tricarboxylate transporter substrate binding protein n=1 Tax=Cupriavidus pauculus TaxID=82633 RepID=A0A5P2HH89_9BURK|nr:tripartite tricarboxylate transporter substrate binding protein [Cupriavidus pauculus]QET06450.1 tripartite tricarboxylate transporter substrate binding protein [Cupriavidus pauculus]